MEDNKRYWVGLNHVKGIGARRMMSLLDYFGEAQNVWEANPDALREAGMGQKVIENLLALRTNRSVDEIWQEIQAQGIQVLTWEDPGYPQRLNEIPLPPPVIYLRGELSAADDWAIAVVGTRRMTVYGRQVAEEIGRTLAPKGITIVSGLARGVDGAAHQAALNAGGRTIAVLGSGVDIIYPPEHRRLAEQIIENGALISDYPPGSAPDAANFPPRNRIISGLARAVIVVEAAKSSGALITAAFAAEQGREVFAVPGNIYALQNQGTNLLIQQGARPFLNCEDVLDVLNLVHAAEQHQARQLMPADTTEAQLIGLLSDEALHVDEIRLQTELPIEKVTATLVMMELKGMVRHVGGMQYIAIREAIEKYQVD